MNLDNGEAKSNLHYRPEIDGLRALAVLPVVLFHAGISWISGGFVGVDVFFVISGYLIAKILYRDAINKKFSIVKFYERRIRRIMPNLLAMLLVTAIASGFILIPNDYSAFAKSLFSTLAFLSNIYFYTHTGYFSPTSQQLPLLHMWSLGVEEQYYLLFPFILWALAQRSRVLLICGLAGLFVASLLLSVYQVQYATSAAFYLPFSRLWELMTGSILAVRAIPVISSKPVREAAATAGIGAIVFAIFCYTEATPFPGAAALVPCLGAAALIHSNSAHSTVVGRILAHRSLVFIGIISYSMYIWHWPVIVLTHYALQRYLSIPETLVMLSAIVMLSIAAWHWIEKPMRDKSLPVRHLLLSVGGAATVAVALAVTIISTAGLPQRYDPKTRALALAANNINPDRAQCDHPSSTRIEAGDVCHIGPDGEPRFAVIGDSFGDALSPGFKKSAAEAGVPGVVMTFSGCAPLPDVDEKAGICRSQVNDAYALLSREKSLRKVILVGRWPTMISGYRFGLFKQGGIFFSDATSKAFSQEENKHVLARGFARAVQAVPQAELVVVTGIPEQLVHVPQAASLAPRFGIQTTGITRKQFDERQAWIDPVLDEAGEITHHSLRVASLASAMCDNRFCPIVDNDIALFVDDNHPSRTYAERLAGQFVGMIR